MIILNWNGWEETIECLESVFQNNYPDFYPIVVDNGSTNQSIEKIREYCEGKIPCNSQYFQSGRNGRLVNLIELSAEGIQRDGDDLQPDHQSLILIKNRENLGYAGGNNVGIAYCLETLHPDYILLLNNDTVIPQNCIRNLVGCMENHANYGLVQPIILFYQTDLIENSGYSLDIWGGAYPLKRYQKYKKSTEVNNQEFFYASGACLMLRPGILKELDEHGFDPTFFLYYEDVDLSWRIRLKGYGIGICPDTVCYHREGSSCAKLKEKRFYYRNRNRLRLLLKNYSFFSLILFLPQALFLGFISAMFFSVKEKTTEYFWMFLSAIGGNTRDIVQVLKKRRLIQTMRKTDDARIIRTMNFSPHNLDYQLIHHKNAEEIRP